MMGREVRMVPKDWEHPKDDNGRYQPMYDEDFETAAARWKSGYASHPPDRKYYRPPWLDEERTHYQMYETCSEGTPISPVMDTPEHLARWLADNNASAFAKINCTYEQWLKMIKGSGSSVSMVVTDGVMRSGVELESARSE